MSQYFKISKANSIRFADRTSSTKLNDYNTLSCESLNKFPYKEIQMFTTSDTITTQFRSNYTTITAKITDENNVDTSLTVTKKTTNMGRQYKLDGKYYNYKSEGVYTGIYFDTGNIYTYDTSTIIGSHSLNGELPEFAILGETIDITGLGSFTIDRIVYDEDIDSNVILVTNAYTGAVTSTQIQSEYDILPYEVYEFDIDFSTLNGLYYVTITNNAVGFGTITVRSEYIDVQDSFTDVLEVIYYNSNNDDILYSTGIQHKLWLHYDKVVAVSDPESEITITDTTAILIDSKIDEKNTFYFKEISTELMRKIKIALSSETVIINDIGYVTDGKIQEEYIENTNLYSLNATMVKTGDYYFIPEYTYTDAADAFISRADTDGATISASDTCIYDDYANNY